MIPSSQLCLAPGIKSIIEKLTDNIEDRYTYTQLKYFGTRLMSERSRFETLLYMPTLPQPVQFDITEKIIPKLDEAIEEVNRRINTGEVCDKPEVYRFSFKELTRQLKTIQC